MTDYRKTNFKLGIRNNNPGNIRPSDKYTWNGAVGVNKGFVVFQDIEHGIRALAIDLFNKNARGLNTIRKIISVYAPPSENNTEAYIASVCGQMTAQLGKAIPPDGEFEFDKSIMITMIRAIVNHENGPQALQLIKGTIILAGLNLLPESITEKLK